jgi:hypothetical protein
MLNRIWQFLQDEKNQRMLTLIGGGLVVVVGGLWAAFRLFLPSTRGEARSATKADRSRVRQRRHWRGCVGHDDHRRQHGRLHET